MSCCFTDVNVCKGDGQWLHSHIKNIQNKEVSSLRSSSDELWCELRHLCRLPCQTRRWGFTTHIHQLAHKLKEHLFCSFVLGLNRKSQLSQYFVDQKLSLSVINTLPFKSLGSGFFFYFYETCSPGLHLFDQKHCKNNSVKYEINAEKNTAAIPPVFSVSWCFTYHSNMLISCLKIFIINVEYNCAA